MKENIIVITGGIRGLGKELAKILTSRGNKAVICGRNKEEIEKTAKEVGATAFVADVTKETDVKALAEFTIKSFRRIDIWINNAGVWTPHALIEDTDIQRVRGMFEVNVFGTMYGSKAALLQMRKQGEGILVNIISTSALTSRPMSSGYASSKWALRGFTNSIREEYKEAKIKIIGVYPGGMKTNLFDEKKPDDIGEYMDPESVAEKIVANLEQERPIEELILKRPAQSL